MKTPSPNLEDAAEEINRIHRETFPSDFSASDDEEFNFLDADGVDMSIDLSDEETI